MSRLKELRLHGFKSFADPTRFAFEPGVNAVIGPNGSGKSNMADAVRWVLGEQSNRSLRTRRADDVIFGGSDSRRPQGMAEAVLTLDNRDGWLPIDFGEVSIGRRAYRSGEGEYLINGARTRLRDVVGLLGEGRLGANELVVVGQGTVDAALSLRPEERRQLFEEAAGVKGLQVRRNEASARLGRARDNLVRVSDLIGELRPQVRRLALQAEHQQQHDTLGARARALVAVTHRRRERAARAALGEARRQAAAAEAALAAYRAEQDASRTAAREAEERYWGAEEAAREAVSARQAAREALIRLEARAEAATARAVEASRLLEAEERELAELEAWLADPPAADGDERVDPALDAARDAERGWQAAVAELAAADDELLAAEQAAAAVRAGQSDRIARLARHEETLERQRARREHAVAERDAAAAAVVEADAARVTAAEAQERTAEAAAEALAALETRGRARDAAQARFDEATQRALDLGERLRATRAELNALTEPHDVASRLGHRLARAGWREVLDTLDAPEDAWPAIEAVVGGDLDAALLWADADPTGPLEGARGTARLLAPANGNRSADRAAALNAVGAERTLAEWVGSGADVAALSRTVLAPTVAALLSGWQRLPAGWAAVTPEGDVADARGVALRGRSDPPGGATARAHARRRALADAVSAMEADHAAAQASASTAGEALRAARAAHLAAREDHDEAERTARVARDARAAAEATLARARERLARAEEDLAAVDAEGADEPLPPPDADDAARRLAHLTAAADAARSRREALARRRDEARDAWTATRRAAEEAQHRAASTRTDHAAREGRAAQLRLALPTRRASRDELADEAAAFRAPLDEARSQVADAERAVAETEERRALRRSELQRIEGELGGSGARLAELEGASQSAAIEASRRDESLASLLRERDMALESLPESDGASDAPAFLLEELEALDDDALESELRRVRRTLAQIGSVNPFAVEEHRELAARMEEMSGQDADLRAAIESTEELIATLDAEIAGQFDAAFRAIGEKFDEYCRLLFAGGSAALQIGDESDGDAPGGIEIVVRPPGKRLQRLAMLSGGERALTGVALLFAMLTVNPVPFCILDEVDAALDEANIGRFAEALRRLSESIDFVVITHNRATIEVADTIYGVTMTDAAVSRVLSLRLADIPAEVGA